MVDSVISVGSAGHSKCHHSRLLEDAQTCMRFHIDTDSAARSCRPPLWLAANVEAIYGAVSVVWGEE